MFNICYKTKKILLTFETLTKAKTKGGILNEGEIFRKYMEGKIYRETNISKQRKRIKELKLSRNSQGLKATRN